MTLARFAHPADVSPVPTGGQVPGLGALLARIRASSGMSRHELVEWSGLARSTVSKRVDMLIANRLVVETSGDVATTGRPPGILRFNRTAGVLFAADIGADPAHVAIGDLGGAPIAHAPVTGGRATLQGVLEELERLMRASAPATTRVLGVAVGVPESREADADDLAATSALAGDGASVIVSDAAGLAALGTHRLRWPHTSDLVHVSIDDQITCGIIAGGRLCEGVAGAAGRIAHIAVPRRAESVCRCGNVGCLDSQASGRAIAAALDARGRPAKDAADVGRLLREGDSLAIALARNAGRDLGAVLATIVHLFAPDVIVIGGALGESNEHLIAGVREGVHQRAAPRQTRALEIAPGMLGDRAASLGGLCAIAEHVLTPTAVDRALSGARRPSTEGRCRPLAM